MQALLSPEISHWISKTIAADTGQENLTVLQLAGDASARRYYRLIQGERTWILMSWEPFSSADYPFLSVQKHFAAAGVSVPAVLAVNEDLGLLLLEDLGDLTLERKFWESPNPEDSDFFYKKTLDELIRIHDVATSADIKSTASVTAFDTAKFLWEMNYAKEHLLSGLLKIKFSAAEANELEKTFIHFCEILHKKPKVICHRDFHSRNVMIKLDQVRIIDFQDARLGPAQYDLVSLFRDSYVDMSEEYAQKLMTYYLENSQITARPGFNRDEFSETYELQSLQRCFKACGSFASFMNMRNDRRYLKYLAPTLKKVMKSLTHFPQYSLITNLLLDSGALEKNYETLS